MVVQGSESGVFFQGLSILPGESLDLTHEPHPRFPVRGHRLSIGGDALRILKSFDFTNLFYKTLATMELYTPHG
jgi:hypothetical protein